MMHDNKLHADAQQLFTTAATHMLQQGKKSTKRHTTSCLYRGPDGLKCAVGVLITDEEYKPEMEEKTVWELCDDDLLPERLRPHAQMLRSLQRIHDDSKVEHWAEGIQSLAAAHGFTFELHETVPA